eukprot:gene13361-9190_t
MMNKSNQVTYRTRFVFQSNFCFTSDKQFATLLYIYLMKIINFANFGHSFFLSSKMICFPFIYLYFICLKLLKYLFSIVFIESLREVIRIIRIIINNTPLCDIVCLHGLLVLFLIYFYFSCGPYSNVSNYYYYYLLLFFSRVLSFEDVIIIITKNNSSQLMRSDRGKKKLPHIILSIIFIIFEIEVINYHKSIMKTNISSLKKLSDEKEEC